MKEKDLKVVPIMHAAVNEEIKARFEHSGENTKAFADGALSDSMIEY